MKKLTLTLIAAFTLFSTISHGRSLASVSGASTGGGDGQSVCPFASKDVSRYANTAYLPSKDPNSSVNGGAVKGTR